MINSNKIHVLDQAYRITHNFRQTKNSFQSNIKLEPFKLNSIAMMFKICSKKNYYFCVKMLLFFVFVLLQNALNLEPNVRFYSKVSHLLHISQIQLLNSKTKCVTTRFSINLKMTYV